MGPGPIYSNAFPPLSGEVAIHVASLWMDDSRHPASAGEGRICTNDDHRDRIPDAGFREVLERWSYPELILHVRKPTYRGPLGKLRIPSADGLQCSYRDSTVHQRAREQAKNPGDNDFGRTGL